MGRSNQCQQCGQYGHNRRGCPQIKEAHARVERLAEKYGVYRSEEELLMLLPLGLKESTRLPRFKTPMRMKSPGVTAGSGKRLRPVRLLRSARMLVVASVASAVSVDTTLAPAQPRSNIAKIVMPCEAWLTEFWLPASRRLASCLVL